MRAAIMVGAFALTACATGDNAESMAASSATDANSSMLPSEPAPSSSDPDPGDPSPMVPPSLEPNSTPTPGESNPASGGAAPVEPSGPADGGAPQGEAGEGGDVGAGGSAGSGGSSASGAGGEVAFAGSGGSSNGGAAGAGLGGGSGAGGDMPVAGAGGSSPAPDDMSMSFFVTSRGMGDGGNLGGLEGADAFCGELAAAVEPALGARTWRAYLSTSTVDARDRIGEGPWRNVELVVVANDVAELHQQEAGEALDATWPPMDTGIALDETGAELENEVHDVLTGSNPDGTALADSTCADWTSNSSDDQAQVGHTNRSGGGRPPYFNSTHEVGCAEGMENYESGTITQGGGRGSFYCFRVD